MSTAFDFTELINLTILLQDKFHCINCKLEYPKKWCKDDKTTCFYCTHFLPMRDTYYSILKDIEWYFIRSGEDNRQEYYTAYLENLKKWSNRFHVFPTKSDLRYEQDLLVDLEIS
jgi:hypothetical protein